MAQIPIHCILGLNRVSQKGGPLQIGITIEFLIVVRTLGEFFRLRHVYGTNFSTAMAALYVGGALIAVCSSWAGVTLYFFRRYTLSAWITLATIPVLLVYKIAVVGWQ